MLKKILKWWLISSVVLGLVIAIGQIIAPQNVQPNAIKPSSTAKDENNKEPAQLSGVKKLQDENTQQQGKKQPDATNQTNLIDEEKLLAESFQELKTICQKEVKDFALEERRVVKQYEKVMPQCLTAYLPGKSSGNNAAYLLVNQKCWNDASPKLRIAMTDAAYLIEVCNPKTSTMPTLIIADSKSMKVLNTRTFNKIGGWF